MGARKNFPGAGGLGTN